MFGVFCYFSFIVMLLPQFPPGSHPRGYLYSMFI